MATRRSKRQSKGVNGVVTEEANVNTGGQTDSICEQTAGQTEEIKITESTEAKKEEDQNDQDSQEDMVIEVKGSATTVAVTWNEKKEGELEEKEKDTGASNPITDTGGEQRVSSADEVNVPEDAPTDNTVSKIQQDVEEPESEDTQMDTGENESTPTVTVTGEMKDDAEKSDVKKETDGDEVIVVKKKAGKGKRKAQTVETSPPKKIKFMNDGFCLFVGNLNNSKKFEEVKDSLANYFMTQSILFQDIRLDRSRKHAHVDLASEMDLTKALTLDGEMVLEKPMKIAKAKVKSEEKVKVKVPPEDKKADKDARCLFLKNVPYDATKEDIMKSFRKAVTVRFPGGAENPAKGIAFVEFKSKSVAEKVRQQKRVVEIQGRVLIVDSVGPRDEPKVTKTNDDNNTKAEVPPNNILFVNNLSYNAREKDLKKVFQTAVKVKVPQGKGKPKGCAFVEFATVADAETALKSSENMQICKRAIKVQFCEKREKQEKKKVESKTLVVMGLAEKTTSDTLKSVFEEALIARVIQDKTGVSKRFGFVDFESEEKSKSAKKAMEDCEIDGQKVTIAYAKQKGEKVSAGGRPALAERPAGQGAVSGGKGRGAGSRKDAVKKNKNKA
ncbi:nucleolin-like [Notolabrus celidotus]|uniref:nucleolin-like n=1 Tax=Notolabrus celidotus TaxID=1203425 RepID=UPI0014905533|nr:nucleolin-like [Notolabrus celidotus]